MARNTKLKSETEAPENIPFTMKKMARLAKCQPEDSGIEMVMASVNIFGHKLSSLDTSYVTGGKRTRKAGRVRFKDRQSDVSALLRHLPPSLHATQDALLVIAQVSNVLLLEGTKLPALRYHRKHGNYEPSAFMPVRLRDETFRKRSPRMLALMKQAIKFRRRSSVQGDASADVHNAAQADDAAEPEAEQGGLQAPAGDAPLATAEDAQPAAAEDAPLATAEDAQPATAEDAQPAIAGDAQPAIAGDAQPAAAEDAQPAAAGDEQPDAAGDAQSAAAEDTQPATADDAVSTIMETASDDGECLLDAGHFDYGGHTEMDTAPDDVAPAGPLPAAADGNHGPISAAVLSDDDDDDDDDSDGDDVNAENDDINGMIGSDDEEGCADDFDALKPVQSEFALIGDTSTKKFFFLALERSTSRFPDAAVLVWEPSTEQLFCEGKHSGKTRQHSNCVRDTHGLCDFQLFFKESLKDIGQHQGCNAVNDLPIRRHLTRYLTLFWKSKQRAFLLRPTGGKLKCYSCERKDCQHALECYDAGHKPSDPVEGSNDAPLVGFMDGEYNAPYAASYLSSSAPSLLVPNSDAHWSPITRLSAKDFYSRQACGAMQVADSSAEPFRPFSEEQAVACASHVMAGVAWLRVGCCLVQGGVVAMELPVCGTCSALVHVAVESSGPAVSTVSCDQRADVFVGSLQSSADGKPYAWAMDMALVRSFVTSYGATNIRQLYQTFCSTVPGDSLDRLLGPLLGLPQPDRR